MDTKKKITETCKFLSSKAKYRPKIALVLGSGFGELGLKDSVSFKFKEIPYFQPASVEGHKGVLEIGLLEGVQVLVLKGRLHLYEGHSVDEVVYPIRVMSEFGIKTLILTNAVGGINKNLKKGDLMVISDHINLTGTSPLVGKKTHDRFLDLTDAYNPGLREKIKNSFAGVGIGFNEGVYCGVLGPNYETPAEIKFFKTVGADVVGMSTVLECITAREMGMEVLGISIVSNLVPSTEKITHKDVFKQAKISFQNFDKLIREFITEL